MRTITFRLILFVLLMPVLLAAKNASDSDNVHSEIQTVYNFSPHSLTKEQISGKSAVLDQFWAKAKAQKAVYVPALRKELSDFSNPPFFLYDGNNLLLSLSDDRADRRLILAAVSHSDLKDVQPLDYFLLVHKMAPANSPGGAANSGVSLATEGPCVASGNFCAKALGVRKIKARKPSPIKEQ